MFTAVWIRDKIVNVLCGPCKSRVLETVGAGALVRGKCMTVKQRHCAGDRSFQCPLLAS